MLSRSPVFGRLSETVLPISVDCRLTVDGSDGLMNWGNVYYL